MSSKDHAARRILVTVLLGTFTVSLNNSALNLAIPELMRVFDAGAARVSWVMTLFLVAMGMTMPLTGFLADRWGGRRLYLLGLWLFLGASLLGAVAANLAWVLTARGLQGIAAGLMIPLSLPLIFAVCPADRRGRVTGIWGFAVMIAPAIGPSVGGLLLELSRWQALFLMNLPVAVLALWSGHRHLEAGRRDRARRFDLRGFLLVTLGMGGVLFALGATSSPDDLREAMRWGPLAAGALLLIAFVRLERRVAHPLLDLGLFAVRTYRASVLVACAQAVATFGCLLLIPIWMQHVQGHDALTTGLIFLPTALMAAACSPWAGRLVDRRAPRGVVTLGLVVTAAALLGLAALGPEAPLWLIVVLMAARGAGLGCGYLPVTTVGLNAVPDTRVAQASAINNLCRRLASSLGVVVLALHHDLRTAQLLAQGASARAAGLAALGEAFVSLALLILLATLLASSLSSTRREVTPDHDPLRATQNPRR
ncbi:DHA2 family efflux MFS transporter permease subunit [Halomonas kalidii]|uniref:DHA2 family efflux MFS transporter permease subunit n=1 Tax=Halomonas kalidii TaxID=3043293 RepID=A0ABT6VTP0_9GAMM|nr:DHA2 family efflux MFS transporter permease subunit [Halomonas kalidii]MDI5936617.1 DHA2 family efflux MFS transporter permease subunit [Halomonas kalidii]